MNSVLLSLYTGIQQWILREEGQDLIEYALIAALLALGPPSPSATLAPM